jgi:hypothetical protein
VGILGKPRHVEGCVCCQCRAGKCGPDCECIECFEQAEFYATLESWGLPSACVLYPSGRTEDELDDELACEDDESFGSGSISNFPI